MRPAVLVACLALSACTGDATAPTGHGKPTTTTPPPAAAARADLDGLPVGPPPLLGYADGPVFRHPDGATTELPGARRHGVSGVVVTDAGLLVSDQRWFEGTNGLRLVTDDGSTALGPCTSGAGASEAGRAAWVTFGCPESGVVTPTVLHLLDDEGRETTYPIAVEPGTSGQLVVAGFLDGDVLVQELFGRDGVTRYDEHGHPREVPGVLGTWSVDEVGGLLVGLVPEDGDGDVTGVVDSRDGQVLWRTRGDVGPFSPDGTRLVRRGRGEVVRIVDARTGRAVATLAVPAGAGLAGFAWEDDEHLLAVATLDATQAVVRFDRRGRVERATDVVPVREGPWGPVTLVLQTRG